jgi:hypothetical protein
MILSAPTTSNADNIELNKLLRNDRLGIWKLNNDTFRRQFHADKLFSSLNSEQTELRYFFKNKHHEMFFCGIKVYDAVFSFDDNRLCRMYISLYNRGDAGDMEQEKFEALLQKIEQNIEGLAGKKADDAPVYPVGMQKLYEKNFFCKNYNFKLQWSSSISAKDKFHAAYIQLIILPPGSRNESIAVDLSLTADNLKSRVQHDKNGDCLIDMPMVHQGGQGYCVPATEERLAKYYGSSLNQHVFAQAYITGKGKTKQKKAFEETIGLHEMTLYNNSDFSGETNVRKIFEMYNAEAVKARVQGLNPDDFIKKTNGKAKFHYKTILLAMDQKLYLKAKSNDSGGMAKFKDVIISNIDRGIPLIWRVKTGLFGKHRKGIGKHRRLIVGYNSRENVIIYSDSWGARHEHKKTSWEKAWASSNGITLCLPKSLVATVNGKLPTSEEDDDDDDDNNDD